MYQPISFDVIRQALDWHGFPVPHLRQLSFYEWTDYLSAEYYAVWSWLDIPAHYCVHSLEDGDTGFQEFKRDLAACFCDDVTIIQLHFDPDNRHMYALLHVQLAKNPAQLAFNF